jgi:hypothetical protein
MVSGHMFHHTSRDLVTVVVLEHQAAHRAVKPLHHTIVITSEFSWGSMRGQALERPPESRLSRLQLALSRLATGAWGDSVRRPTRDLGQAPG